MKTYLAVKNNGDTTHISAYTYADAYQQATSWAGDDGLRDFNEV
jgi:hypothetical protein